MECLSKSSPDSYTQLTRRTHQHPYFLFFFTDGVGDVGGILRHACQQQLPSITDPECYREDSLRVGITVGTSDDENVNEVADNFIDRMRKLFTAEYRSRGYRAR
jgi:hypothetical protein